MRTSRRVQVIASVIGIVTGIIMVDGEPTKKELIGGAILIMVVVANLLVTAYQNEFKEYKR